MGVVTMEGASMRERQGRREVVWWWAEVVPLMLAAATALAGGCGTPSAQTTSRNYTLRRDIPVDPPGPPPEAEDDCAQGGRLFKLYCGSCHNARPLGERPFSNYHVAVTHMRDQAYLTGKEYRQIIHFLRHWQDVGPPTPDVRPSPKRFVFSQPISELRKEAAGEAAAPPPPPAGPGPFEKPAGAAGAAPPQQPAQGLPPAID
jgi:hypothetical protein